jgi:histone chaperone ASF1
MSVVSLLGVNILNNPARFTDNYQFEITFECLEQLEKGEKLSASPTANPSCL